MSNPFKEFCKEYKNNGYSVIPLVYKQKYPLIKDWSRFGRIHASDENLELWSKQNFNIGVCLGSASKCIAIDLDYDIDNLHEKIKKHLPETPLSKIGSKGITLFYKYNGEKNKKWRCKGESVIELLSEGNQTVVPPSIHPEGMIYEWQDKSMADIDASTLPRLPENFYEEMDKIFGVKKTNDNQIEFTKYERKTDDEDIIKAINYIPSDDYFTWVDMGMALHDHYAGGGQGLAIWNDWSKGSSKYSGGNEIEKKWRSFGSRTDVIKIGTLFKFANDHGYEFESKEYSTAEINNLKLDYKKLMNVAKDDSLGFNIIEAPGLVGKIQDYINTTSLYKQPMLALSAAITAAGTIYAHKVRSKTDLRTNFYCLSVGETGCGKNHPRMAVISLFKKCGIEDMIGGDPASDAGLLASIKKGEGVRLLQIDEFGHYLKSVRKSDAPKYLMSIMANFTKLFTSANTTYYGQEYSERTSKLPRQDIEQPCLNVLGSTTPDRLNGSLSSDDILDGFLTRWLILESKIYAPDFNEDRINLEECVDTNLFREIKEIAKMSKNHSKGVGLAERMLSISPLYISEDKEAKKISEKFYKKIQKLRMEAIRAGDKFKGVYTRAYEHYLKLCLIANENMIITEKSANWAKEMVEYNLAKIKTLVAEDIYDNKHEENVLKLEKIIKKANIIKSSDLYIKTKGMRPQERKEALSYLLEAGKVEHVVEKQNNQKGKPPSYYKIKEDK